MDVNLWQYTVAKRHFAQVRRGVIANPARAQRANSEHDNA